MSKRKNKPVKKDHRDAFPSWMGRGMASGALSHPRGWPRGVVSRLPDPEFVQIDLDRLVKNPQAGVITIRMNYQGNVHQITLTRKS